MKTYIYILQDPITEVVKYVGKSNKPKKRFQSHISNNKSTTHTNSWIKSLKNKGLKPIMTTIDETDGDWEELEKYWIEQFKNWGFYLTNHTLGGEGVYGAGQWNNRIVTAYDKEGVFIKSFVSQKECAKYFNTSQSNVKQAANGKILLLCKKYQIRFGENKENIGKVPSYKKYEFKIKIELHWKCRRIKCNEDGLIFNSLTEAANYYKIKIESIFNILAGNAKKTRGGKSFIYL